MIASLQRLLLRIFPRPRGRVTWPQALPLLLFLLVFAALCVGLEWADRLLFSRPWMFLLMLVTPWVWWMHVAGYSGLPRSRAVVALLIRLAAVGAFVMLLAEPRSVRTNETLSVVYAVDTSNSIGESSSDSALRFLTETVSKKPQKDLAGLVVFGRNASVELPPRMSFPFESDSIAINSRIDPEATNLEQALSLSAAMLPGDQPGRIVLISDGMSTEGNLVPVLDDLKSRKIAVDVLPIQYDYDQEVWLERLELPRYVKLGENYEAIIVLSSLKEGNGKLSLTENGNVVFQDEVQFRPGKNRYVVPIKLRNAGYYEYAASIDVPETVDHLRQNNTVLNYIYVEGEGKVLVVTDPQGDERDWKSLADAIKQEQRVVEVQAAYNFPRDALSLMPYDAIVFVNVPADLFDAVQFQALHDAVRDLGVGFLMVGGKNSFGPGGYHHTKVEDALPVTMDVTKKKILPKGALAIILHTCEFPEGNTWGKRITKKAIEVLGAQDEVGVLAYDFQAGESWIFELTPASEYEKLALKINAAQIGDMPSFTPTMQAALAGLKKSDAATKHMIIISDGDPQPPPQPLLQEFVDNQISITTVSIFPHGGMEIDTMRAIANVTGGRYYNPTDPNLLPSIFIKESKTLKRGMIQNKTITPEIGFPSPVLKGIDAIPPLHGYVLATPRERAETILRAPAEEEQLDPILAKGKHGLGSTAAFLSDLSPNWGADWVSWDKFRAFVKQLMTEVSRVRKEGHLRLYSYTSGNQGVILVEDFHPEKTFLEVQARVSGPREQAQNVTLKQIGPQRYQATFPLWGAGRYQVMGVGVAGERTDRAQGGFIVSYSPEYLRFRSNPIVLNEIAEKTGGMMLSKEDAVDEIYLSRREARQSSSPIFDWFLIGLAIAIPLDVGVRRVQIDKYALKSLLGLNRRRGDSTETMSALLQRKKEVGTALDAQRESSKPAARAATAAPRPATPMLDKPRDTGSPQSQRPVPKEPEKPAPTHPADGTTGRLLEMKRRRQQDQDEPGRK